jgi:hypothetical protein
MGTKHKSSQHRRGGKTADTWDSGLWLGQNNQSKPELSLPTRTMARGASSDNLTSAPTSVEWGEPWEVAAEEEQYEANITIPRSPFDTDSVVDRLDYQAHDSAHSKDERRGKGKGKAAFGDAPDSDMNYPDYDESSSYKPHGGVETAATDEYEDPELAAAIEESRASYYGNMPVASSAYGPAYGQTPEECDDPNDGAKTPTKPEPSKSLITGTQGQYEWIDDSKTPFPLTLFILLCLLLNLSRESHTKLAQWTGFKVEQSSSFQPGEVSG